MNIRKKIKIPKMVTKFDNTEKVILRDYLALERTTMANIRTVFSVIRTSIYLVLAGIAFISLDDFESLEWIGYVLFGISLLFIIIGLARFFELRSKLRKLYKPIKELESQSE